MVKFARILRSDFSDPKIHSDPFVAPDEQLVDLISRTVSRFEFYTCIKYLSLFSAYESFTRCSSWCEGMKI